MPQANEKTIHPAPTADVIRNIIKSVIGGSMSEQDATDTMFVLFGTSTEPPRQFEKI